MNIAKLNLSHGTHTKHARYVETIRSLAEGAGTPVAILMDLLGHKYRTGNFAGGSVVLEKDAYVTFTSRQTEGMRQPYRLTFRTSRST
ncbi:MAG: pyruvate kinase [Dehalococcoidia bacterium]|nr:pyruvate kinase [Dehalococcoidia bacterium]